MPTTSQNVAALCLEYDALAVTYAEQLERKAHAEADYRRDRAKRMMRARVQDGEKAISGAEMIADADDEIHAARTEYLISEGLCTATKARLMTLQERIGFGRSLLTTEREQDKLHASNAGGHA